MWQASNHLSPAVPSSRAPCWAVGSCLQETACTPRECSWDPEPCEPLEASTSWVQALCDMAGISGPRPGELGLGMTRGSSRLPSCPPTGPGLVGSLCSPNVIPKGGRQSFPRGADWREWPTCTKTKAEGTSLAETRNRETHQQPRTGLSDHRPCKQQAFPTDGGLERAGHRAGTVGRVSAHPPLARPGQGPGNHARLCRNTRPSSADLQENR